MQNASICMQVGSANKISLECSLLLPMIAVSVCLSVCLSRGTTRLHCAITTERIKMLLRVNNLGGPRDIVLHGGPDPPHRQWEGDLLLNFGTSLLSPKLAT